MTLHVHVYADDPRDRFVFIDGRRYVEGDRVDGRYRLDAITPEGVVLSRGDEHARLRSKTPPPRRP
jgi:hypothetical protein